MAGLSPLRRTTTSGRIAAEVRRRIWTGEYPSGSRLHQDEMAAALGVSRIPVREALITLAHEGIVDVEPHRGAFVARIDEAAVRDHYDLFAHLDGFALAKTIERVDPEEKQALARAMGQAGETGDVDELHRLVMGVRRRLHEVGGSRRFEAVAAGLRGLVPGNFFAEVPGAAAVARRWMPLVGAAVSDGDVDGATHAYREMLHEHADLVVEVLRARGVLIDGEDDDE